MQETKELMDLKMLEDLTKSVKSLKGKSIVGNLHDKLKTEHEKMSKARKAAGIPAKAAKQSPKVLTVATSTADLKGPAEETDCPVT